METIKNIITDNDKRGISMLLPHVSDTVCEDAANIILNNPNKEIILSGFYILSAGAAETDGPIGAIAIGNALKKIGYQVTYITDEFSQPPIKKYYQQMIISKFSQCKIMNKVLLLLIK